MSIGLPVFNGEAYLLDALESLLAQDFTEFELVISDNASTDATEEICREAASRDSRVAYHRRSSNEGAAQNFSGLLQLTRGTYFRWAAHDDACEKDYLSRCVDVMKQSDQVSLCFARSVLIDAKGHTLGIEDLPTPATCARTPARVRSLLLDRRFPSSAPFGLMRRSQALGTSLIQPYKGSDRTFLLEMAMLGRFYQIADPLYLHRRHDQRSVALPAHQRLAWWDGGAEGRTFYPRSRLLRGYAAAVVGSDLSPVQKLEATTYLIPWMVLNASPVARESARRIRAPRRPPREAVVMNKDA